MNIKQELDRRSWASNTVIVFDYETKGSGTFTTPMLEFGLPFEGPPLFTYGVERHSLQGEFPDGDFPHVSAGVGAWNRLEEDYEDFEEKKLLLPHVGATIWISVKSGQSYRLVFRLAFEGVAYKNPQYFGG